jgi:hypothetical protein
VRLLVSSAIRLSNGGAIGRFGSAAAVLMAEAGRVVISEDCLAAQDEMLAAMNDAVKCRELRPQARNTCVRPPPDYFLFAKVIKSHKSAFIGYTFGQLEGLLRLGNGNHETPPPGYFLFRMSVASVWRLG